MFYASEMVGGLVPMLFTPVPGSIMFEQYEEYLFSEMGFDLHHLSGKLYPFLRIQLLTQGDPTGRLRCAGVPSVSPERKDDRPDVPARPQ